MLKRRGATAGWKTLLSLSTLIALAPRVTRAQSGGVEIVLDDSFSEKNGVASDVRRSFQKVAEDVLAVDLKRFGGMEPQNTRAIILGLGEEKTPRTIWSADSTVVKVNLAMSPESVEGRRYGQFVFQLGHELGHVFMGIHRTNGVIEVLADANSFQSLSDLSELWRGQFADVPEYKWWSTALLGYRSNVEDDGVKMLPADSFGDAEKMKSFVYAQQAVIDQDIEAESALPLRMLSAVFFLAEPVRWELLKGLENSTSPSPAEDPSFRKDLPLDPSRLSEERKNHLRRFRRIP